MDIYTKEFKNYCNSLITKHKILITNEQEWYRSIWQKGWNQYQLIYKLYTKNGYQKITDDMLITLYKANIRIRNVLYEFSLLIEESFKAWLYFKGIDNTNRLNNKTIGKLIESVNDIDKQNFLIETCQKSKINIENYQIIEIYESWRIVRNLSCHRGSKMILEERNLFTDLKNMSLLLTDSMKNKYISKLKSALEHVKEFIKINWKEELECLLKN